MYYEGKTTQISVGISYVPSMHFESNEYLKNNDGFLEKQVTRLGDVGKNKVNWSALLSGSGRIRLTNLKKWNLRCIILNNIKIYN